MDPFVPDLEQFQTFFLVLIRCSVILFFAPVFGSRNWPAVAKVGFILLLTFILYPKALAQAWPKPENVWDFGLLVAAEILVGMCLGLTIDLILAGIQLAGQLVGFQLGFSIANVLDPQFGTQVSVVGQFIYLVAVLLFLLFDGHHLFVMALAESITAIRPAEIHLTPNLFNLIVKLCLLMFSLSVKIVAPALAVLLFIQAAMGVVAKAVPQINIMIVSFPLTIGAGLAFVGLTMAWLSDYLGGFVARDLGFYLNRTLRTMGGG